MNKKLIVNPVPLINQAIEKEEGYLQNYDDKESYNAAFINGSIHALQQLRRQLQPEPGESDQLLMVIPTKIGEIRVYHSDDGHYAGVIIDVNGFQISRVEADYGENVFQSMLWNTEQEDYVHKVILDQQKLEEEK